MTTMGSGVPPTNGGRHDQAALGQAPSGGRDNRIWVWGVIAIGAVAILAIAAFLIVGDGDDVEATRNLSVSDIVEDGDDMIGDQAVLTGRIDELLTDRALAVGSDMAADDVLVIVAPDALVRGYGLTTGSDLPLPVGETYETGNVVQFTGTLEEFDRDRLADEYGIVLNEELFSAYAGDPALVVDRLDVATYGRPLLMEESTPAA